MSAANNVASVASMYEAFGKGDIPFILSNLAGNCEWIGAGEGLLPQGGTYKGQDALNFFIKLGEAAEFTSFNPTAITAINDNEVVAFGNMSSVSKLTGKSSSSDWIMHWKFDSNGKVVYYQDFYNTAAAYVANQA